MNTCVNIAENFLTLYVTLKIQSPANSELSTDIQTDYWESVSDYKSTLGKGRYGKPECTGQR